MNYNEFQDPFSYRPDDSVGRNLDEEAELEKQIHQLVGTIAGLMPKYREGWVTWRKVAKEIYGSEEYALTLSALAQLDQYKMLFASNERHVRLSAAGMQLAQQPREEKQEGETEEIAKAVRSYAARLERIHIKIHRIARVTKVGKKVVQSVHVNLGDSLIPSETPGPRAFTGG